jgi:hypothetical protein
MKPEQITAFWRRAFGDIAPVGYVCRAAMRDRWLRIHSLPGSKRYPEDAADYAELLLRHNEVATTILGVRLPCLLFIGRFRSSPSASGVSDVPDLEGVRFVDVSKLSTPSDNAPDRIDRLHVAAGLVEWERGRFDRLIQASAEDKTGPVLFASIKSEEAYAPYDGGADLFLNSPERVQVMKQRWSAWLSSRRDGL